MQTETWRVSIVRSDDLHLLLRQTNVNPNGWRPLVSLTAKGSSDRTYHETTLGCDGQCPNSKSGLDMQIIHIPQAKKKARRLNRTVLGSCEYEMGELYKLSKDQAEHDSKQPVILTITQGFVSGSRAKRRSRKESNASSSPDKNKNGRVGPALHVKLIPPGRSLEDSVLARTVGLSSWPEERRSNDSDEPSEKGSSSDSGSESESSHTLHDDEELSPSPSQPSSPESGLRKRRRVRRRITGYACDSDGVEEKWISQSESESEREDSPSPGYDNDEIYSDDSHQDHSISKPTWGWMDHVIPVLELEWWERVLCHFTFYREFKIVEHEEMNLSSNDPSITTHNRYERLYQRLQVEWTYVCGLLIGLAAIDAAIFAISSPSSSTNLPSEAEADLSSSTLFPVDSLARSAVSLSTIATALGLLCDAYFLLYYGWVSVDTFLTRARPASSSQSWGYFALSSRIPTICMLISFIFLVVFLLIVACDAAPPVGLWFLGVFVGMGMWMQYVVRLGRILGKGIRWVVKGVSNGARAVGRGLRGMFVYPSRKESNVGKDIPAAEAAVTRPPPAMTRGPLHT
ncbi:hypothetical protein BDP27DRAFT_1312148 [Rhodocollybia butyracea]|uniref:Transmembrane protein n=1 Tax=Rhodocollybia butyracea TaxID=206335 RepID=A0A9P5Q9S1_9AGAR|nr:hypothetical protein BDP27DRAFT_1312148 [Rhodocollybia butyracea]